MHAFILMFGHASSDFIYRYLRANYLQGGIPSDIGNLSYLHVL